MLRTHRHQPPLALSLSGRQTAGTYLLFRSPPVGSVRQRPESGGQANPVGWQRPCLGTGLLGCRTGRPQVLTGIAEKLIAQQERDTHLNGHTIGWAVGGQSNGLQHGNQVASHRSCWVIRHLPGGPRGRGHQDRSHTVQWTRARGGLLRLGTVSLGMAGR